MTTICDELLDETGLALTDEAGVALTSEAACIDIGGGGDEDHDQITGRGAGRRHARVPQRSRQIIRVVPEPIEVRVEITVSASARVDFGDDEAMMLLY